MANSTPDPATSKSMIRRKLVSAAPTPAADSESIDFDSFSGNDVVFRDLEQIMRPSSAAPATPAGYDEVEALIQRYQTEKSMEASMSEIRRGNSMPDLRLPGSHPGAPRPSRGLPPLTTASHAELERLRNENAQLKQLVNEYREVLEQHDPTLYEEKLVEAEQLLAQKDEEIASLKTQVEEWNEKLKTHRFVPQDDELAQWADELDKERAALTKEQKQLEEEKAELKQDEEDLMKQMREMEVSMARDRADLARQRTELQRLHGEIKHELEVMQRGDASLKERLAQFQRRYQDAVTRPSGPPIQTAPVAAPPPPPVAPPQPPRPRDSSVFKKLFGQG